MLASCVESRPGKHVCVAAAPRLAGELKEGLEMRAGDQETAGENCVFGDRAGVLAFTVSPALSPFGRFPCIEAATAQPTRQSSLWLSGQSPNISPGSPRRRVLLSKNALAASDFAFFSTTARNIDRYAFTENTHRPCQAKKSPRRKLQCVRLASARNRCNSN